jgi:phosphoserine phosphatase RsbU/P
VLQGGAAAVDCQAAGLYLLDEATTSLKLRSSWGMPREKLSEPPRPLAGALADLEAMLGHAVVLGDLDLKSHWNPPENFPAAVCVPVCTPAMILGTLWMFSSEPRSFSDRETNLIEIIAGRLASDLEREMLMREGTDATLLKREFSAVERMQRNQLPAIAPLLDGWDVAGWAAQAGAVGGGFFDWFALPDGRFAVVLADMLNQGMEAAFAAVGVKAAARSHGQYHHDAGALLRAINLTLWTGSCGDQFAEMFCGFVETATGKIRYCCAGQPSVLRFSSKGWESLAQAAPRLGTSPEAGYVEANCPLAPDEMLVVFGGAFRDATNAAGARLGEKGIADPLLRHASASASTLVRIAREALDGRQAAAGSADRAILIIKRKEG